MDLSRVDVVLVRPARAANVAAAARALKNMGIGSLRLVGACEGLRDASARALAYGAWDLLDAAASVDALPLAVRDASFVAGFSGRGGPMSLTPRALALESRRRVGAGRLALVFGPEASGLTNQELRLCHATVTIPTAPEQPSLNLAQAVLLAAYELRIADAAPVEEELAAPAKTGDLESALDELEAGLVAIGYLNPQAPGPILGELRRLLARAAATPREATLLRGIARQIGWAGREVERLRSGS